MPPSRKSPRGALVRSRTRAVQPLARPRVASRSFGHTGPMGNEGKKKTTTEKLFDVAVTIKGIDNESASARRKS